MKRKPISTLVLGLAVVTALIFAGCTLSIPQTTAPDGSASAGVSDEAPAQILDPADTNGGVELLPAESPPSRLTYSNWSTDFALRTVPWDEIISGGPPKDGIPSIDSPEFESVDAASEWMFDRDPVILFEHNGDVRAYPLAILIWHEIVNDEVGGKPVTVTFCPLCNASIVFDREFDGQILDFGTTGLLRNSDLVMYDRQSETWWQQFTGQGIVGEFAGQNLDFLASQVLSFQDFAQEFPEGQVLARPAAPRSYGANPYTNYDSTRGRPFLYQGDLDDRLSSTERVVGIDLDGAVKAFPFSVLSEVGVANDEVGGTPLAVFHKSGTASALDTREIREGRDVGSTAVYDRRLGERLLTFEANDDGTFTDVETGSTWNILGEAVEGELAGETLEQILAFDHFWFAWYAFFPQSEVYGG